MKPIPFNGRLPTERATNTRRRELPPILDDNGAPIFTVEPSPVRVRPFEPGPPVVGFIGRCYDCGDRCTPRVNGRCPGRCPVPVSCSECGGEAMDGHHCHQFSEVDPCGY
jgi:hypothetical protein